MRRVLITFRAVLSPPHRTKLATTKRTSGDWVPLIIERGNLGEVGDLPEDGVESVGLFSGLGWGAIGGRLGSRAGAQSGRIGFAGVHELVAHELGDDVDVLSRTVVVAHCDPRVMALA